MATLYSPRIVTDGLVLYLDAANYRSYPGSGTTWTDVSGNGNNGTLTNGPIFDTANGGNFSFDGVDDFVDIPRTNIDYTPLDSFTMGVWAKVDGVSGDFTFARNTTVFGRGDTANSFGIGMERDTSNVFRWRVGSRAVSFIATNINYVVGRLDYITFSYTPTFQRTYQNGNFIASQDTSGGTGGSFAALDYAIARNRAVPGGNSAWMQGNVYLAHMYNRELTAAEVLQNFNATRSRFGV
jgi:hypothetical protein